MSTEGTQDADDAAGNPAPAIATVGVSKRFGATAALTEADFSCRKGEIHVLLGANGAGKSTLVKILCGALAPDSGTLRVSGREMTFGDPLQAAAAGIAAVFQELSLCPHLTVTENIMLGHEPVGFLGWIDGRRCRQTVHSLFDRLGITHIPPDALVSGLALADRQLVEIAKALSHDPRILIVDEGTSALGREEVERLFSLLGTLRAEGRAIIFISHRMAEVRDVADRMTVFRNGRNAGTFVAAEVSDAELVECMLGHSVRQAFPPRTAPADSAAPILRVEGLTVGTALEGVSFSVRAGEVLGIAGLEGQGQADVLLTLFGVLRRPSAGQIRVHDKPVRLGAPWRAVAAGFVLIPEDRRSQGLVQPMPIRANITLASLARLVRFGLLDPARERRTAQEGIERVQIKVPGLEAPVRTLSGGNQQKVIIAKWLETGGDIFMFYDPTRGVDVGTKSAFYEMVAELAQAGKTVLLYTTELPEFVGLCHRVLVMHKGRIVARLRGDDITESRILSASLGIRSDAAGPTPGDTIHPRSIP